MTATLTWWVLAAVTVAGAAGVLLTREVMRLVASLAVFLLGVAGLYLYYRMPFLAASQVFIYVGGVLVLFVFAIMAMHPGPKGAAQVGRRFDLGAASVSIGLLVLLLMAFGGVAPLLSPAPVRAAVTEDTASALLGALLPHFEVVGGVLLVALVAALTIIGGKEDRG